MLAGILATGYGLFIATSTTGYLKFMNESPSDYGSPEELAFAAGFVGSFIIIQGVAGIIVALGILAGKKWSWTANIVLSSVLIALFALDVAYGEVRSAVGIVFNAFLLSYMFTRPVKLYFGRTSPSLTTSTPATSSLA